MQGVELREDGSFEVEGVRPGSIFARGPSGFMHPDADSSGGCRVRERSDRRGWTTTSRAYRLSLSPVPPFRARVVFDEAPRSGEPATLYVSARLPDPRFVVVWQLVALGVAPDGEFVLKGLHRPVYIRVAPPHGYYLASVDIRRPGHHRYAHGVQARNNRQTDGDTHAAAHRSSRARFAIQVGRLRAS